MLNQLSLYFHTLRHLKCSQIFWQCIRRLYHPTISTKISAITLALPFGIWKRCCLRNTSYFEGSKIIFLNQSIDFDHQTIWENSKKKPGLWQYNLHYFYGLLSNNSTTVLKMLQLLEHWVSACPFYTATAWAPYPISIRIGNLIKYHLNGGKLSEHVLKSLYLQTRFHH